MSSKQPELTLRPNSWQVWFIFVPFAVLAGLICIPIIAVSVLGHLGITDRSSHLPELVFPALILIVVALGMSALVRVRLVCEGPIVLRHGGVVRTKKKLIADMDEASRAHVHTSGQPGSRNFRIHLDFLNDDGLSNGSYHDLPNFSHASQQKLHDYIAQHVPVTGEWILMRGKYIQTETHPG